MAEVRQATHRDIAEIHRLAHIIWPLVYDYMISPEQIKFMLEKMYSIPSLEKQWIDGHKFFLLEHEDQIHGFASCSKMPDTPSMRLHKLYLHPSAQGNGWGKLLMQKIFEMAQSENCTQVELNVNRNNKSIGFYQSIGFTIDKSEDIEIGGGYLMNDYIMIAPLSALNLS
jgi:ribosomal protein S18 acetylase RimI-like enzyme